MKPTTAKGRRATRWRGTLSRNITNPRAAPPISPHSSELKSKGRVLHPVMASIRPVPKGRTGLSTIVLSEPFESATK